MIYKYEPQVSDKRRITHPSFALNVENIDWKISVGSNIILKLKTDSAITNLKDFAIFNVVTLTVDESRHIIEKQIKGKTLDINGYMVDNENYIKEYKWKNALDFEKEFSIEELNIFYNYEKMIDLNKLHISSDSDIETIKMIINTIMKSYERAVQLNIEIWNTDKKLQEMMLILYGYGFFTKERVNEILKANIIKEV
jgi:hypothetical protein